MTRYAIVTNGVVRVVTRADHLWLQANPNAVEVTDPYVGPGWLYDGQNFSQAPVDVPRARLEAISAIKAERDRRKNNGVLVGEHWFHTDPDSRIQHLGLRMMGVNVPPVQWKTMSGVFQTMTPALAAAIFEAVATQDMALFAHAESLIAQVQAAQDPAAIDIRSGWPATFGE